MSYFSVNISVLAVVMLSSKNSGMQLSSFLRCKFLVLRSKGQKTLLLISNFRFFFNPWSLTILPEIRKYCIGFQLGHFNLLEKRCLLIKP